MPMYFSGMPISSSLLLLHQLDLSKHQNVELALQYRARNLCSRFPKPDHVAGKGDGGLVVDEAEEGILQRLRVVVRRPPPPSTHCCSPRRLPDLQFGESGIEIKRSGQNEITGAQDEITSRDQIEVTGAEAISERAGAEHRGDSGGKTPDAIRYDGVNKCRNLDYRRHRSRSSAAGGRRARGAGDAVDWRRRGSPRFPLFPRKRE